MIVGESHVSQFSRLRCSRETWTPAIVFRVASPVRYTWAIVSIERRLEQIYAALAEMQVTDRLTSVEPRTTIVGNQFVASIDFTRGTDRATAANRVSLLLNNIGCLKDHLKSWCKKNEKPFTGDELVDRNIDVAIIHDL